MTTIIYFIRHGEVYNPKGILYVRLPRFRLSEKGREEVTETAHFLEDKQVSQIYASPLLRAQQTAKIIQQHLKLPVLHTNKQILEVRTAYQGKHYSDLDALQSQVYDKPLGKNDETIEQIGERMMAFAADMVKKYPGKEIAVISHGDPVMVLYSVINHRTLDVPTVKGGKYCKHAEVFKFIDHDGVQTMESVFIPEASK